MMLTGAVFIAYTSGTPIEIRQTDDARRFLPSLVIPHDVHPNDAICDKTSGGRPKLDAHQWEEVAESTANAYSAVLAGTRAVVLADRWMRSHEG